MDFSDKAATWDDEQRVIRAKIIGEHISQSLTLKKTDRALEFGCGTGLISFNLQEELGDITCIDIAAGMIGVVNEKIKQYQVKNIKAYQQDIDDGQELSPQYDVIYTSMALHHSTDVEKTLKNLVLLLKTGGSLCVVDLDEEDGSFHKNEEDFNGYNGFDQGKLQKISEQYGLSQVKSHTFYHGTRKIDGVGIPYSLFIMTGKKM